MVGRLISWAKGIVAAFMSHERNAWVRGGFTGRYVAGVRNRTDDFLVAACENVAVGIMSG